VIDDVGIHTCSADTTAPVARAPVQSTVANSTLGTTGSISANITWSAATDDRALPGEIRYRLLRSVNGGAYAGLTGWTTKRTFPQTLTPGTSYRYRVDARDAAGNVDPALGTAFTPTLRQEDTAVTYTGTWLTRLARSSASGGFVRPTTTANAKASSTFTGARSVGVVMEKAATFGVAKVCLFQGTTALPCSTIDVSPTSGLGPRKLVYTRAALNPALSYRVEVSDVSGRIELDAIVLN
jgi:hypothetical protein